MSYQNSHKKSFVVWMTVIFTSMKTSILNAVAVLGFLLLAGVALSPAAWAQKPSPGGSDTKPPPPKSKTTLKVTQFTGDFVNWVNEITINSPQIFTFLSSTQEPGVKGAKYEVSTTPWPASLSPVGAKPNVVASGPLPVGNSGNVGQFQIDLAKFIPPTPPPNTLRYYVHVISLGAQDKPIGLASPAVHINYKRNTTSPVKFEETSPFINSISPNSQRAGKSITLKGGLLPMPSVVLLEPVVAPSQGGPPVVLGVLPVKPASASQTEVTFTLPPAVQKGQYRVWVSSKDLKTKTNSRQLTVLPPQYVYSIYYESITCLEETADGVGSDEPYAIVWGGGLTPEKAYSSSQHWIFGPYENVDSHDGSNSIRTKSTELWRLKDGEAGQLPDASNLIIIFALMENDLNMASHVYREAAKEVNVNFTLLRTQKMDSSYIAERLRDVLAKELDRLTNTPGQFDEDERIDYPQRLNITADDLTLCRNQPGWHFKTLNMKGDGGHYRFTFAMKAELAQ